MIQAVEKWGKTVFLALVDDGKHVSISWTSWIKKCEIVWFWTAFKAASDHYFQKAAKSGGADLLAVDEYQLRNVSIQILGQQPYML